jgi:serine phosphatase RsbU (regulator of sigma subunit)/PAS domain-containing protein/anti-sigma regulatory factor (Ser/Thr protein kinase)
MATERVPEVSGHVSDGGFSAQVTIDDHGIVTAWSAGAEKLLGYMPSQILGRSAAGLLAEGVDDGELQCVIQLPRWNGRIALRRRDGGRMEGKVIAHRRQPYDKRPGEWFVVCAPTELGPGPGDEVLLDLHHEQLRELLVALFDTRLRLRRTNEAWHRATLLDEEDARGLRVTEILDHPEMDKLERVMLRALETGESQTVELYVSAPSESRERSWSVFVTPLKDADGRVQGVGTASLDESEQYRARQRLVLLADASARIGNTLDVTRAAEELGHVVVPRFADFVAVELLASLGGAHESPRESDTPSALVPLRRVAQRSVHPAAPEAVVAPGEVMWYPASSPQVQSLRSGRSLVHRATDPGVRAWMAENPNVAARIRDLGMHSAITVPLTSRGATLGVVGFVRHQNPELFSDDDLMLAEQLTARAATCLDNALRYTRERTTAVALQRNLLPQALPAQAAVEVASRYLPAGVRAGVGGDWFDVIPLSGARVALVVGDVVGHGIHASATMGRLRTAVLTLADIDLPPDELLTHLDDLVARLSAGASDASASEPDAEAGAEAEAEAEAETETEAEAESATGDVGATCLYAVYDPVPRRCTIALAGHPAPVLVTPDGTARLLDLPVGPPLGLGGLPFEATEIELPEGSLLALYTDGLVESRERDVDVGQSLLCQALGPPVANLDGMCDAVLGDLLPDRRSDDVALLIARTMALDDNRVATWDIPADPIAVTTARKQAAAQLQNWGLEQFSFVTEMVVSELVTNAIRYGAPPIHLRLIHVRNLICEVSDASDTSPHLRRARVFDEGGRGLLLVAQLTDSWGTRHTLEGKTIWAEQNLEAAMEQNHAGPGSLASPR